MRIPLKGSIRLPSKACIGFRVKGLGLEGLRVQAGGFGVSGL